MNNQNLQALADLLGSLKEVIQNKELKKEEAQASWLALEELKKCIYEFENLQKMGLGDATSSVATIQPNMPIAPTGNTPDLALKQKEWKKSCKSCGSMFKNALDFAKSLPKGGLCKACSFKKESVPEKEKSTEHMEKANMGLGKPAPGHFHYSPQPATISAPNSNPNASLVSVLPHKGPDMAKMPIQANRPKDVKPVNPIAIKPNNMPRPGTIQGKLDSKI